MANELIPEDSINLPMNDLCRNSIEPVEYARSIAARQIIKNLSEAMNTQFGRGFSVDTLENTRKFYLTYQDRISETVFRKFAVEKSETVFRLFEEKLPDKKELQKKFKEWIAEETGGEES